MHIFAILTFYGLCYILYKVFKIYKKSNVVALSAKGAILKKNIEVKRQRGMILIAPTTMRKRGSKKEKIVLLWINFMGGRDLMETKPLYFKRLNDTAVKELRAVVRRHTKKRFVVRNSNLVEHTPEKTVQVEIGKIMEPLKIGPEYLIEVKVSMAAVKTLWGAGFWSFSRGELEKYIKIPRKSRKEMLLKMLK